MSTKLKKKKNTVKNSERKTEKTWTAKDSDFLISKMLKQINSPDNAKFSMTLEKLSWEYVAFDGFSANDCKTRWETISKEIRKFRTLTEILQDAKDYVKDPYKGQIKKHPDYPKRPLTPYFRFFVENRVEYARKHANMNNLEVTAELSKLYRELSPSIKENYAQQWKKDTISYKNAMAKFKSEHPDYFNTLSFPKDPRQPVTIYKDENLSKFIKDHSKQSEKQCVDALKLQYQKLPDEKKLEYIGKALKEEEEYAEEVRKYDAAHPDSVRKKKRSKLSLTKQERELNDKLQGRPKKPPSNGYNLFCTETMPLLTNFSSQKKIVECGRLWNLKSDEDKQVYQIRYMELKKKYEKSYQDFYQKLTPDQKKKENEIREAKNNKKRSAPLHNLGSKKIKLEKDETTDDDSDDETSDSDDDDNAEMVLNDSTDDDDDDDEEDDDDDNNDSEDTDGEAESENEDDKKKAEDEQLRKLVPARPTIPISALFLYQKAQRKKVESQYPQMTSDEITRLLARRYHELPAHKRHKYVQKETEQRALYNEKMQQYLKEGMKKNGIEAPNKTDAPSPVTGEQLFIEKNSSAFLKKHKTKQVAEAALRTSWSKMNKQKRQPYIVQAHKENEKNITAHQARLKEADNNKNTQSSPVKPPSRNKLKLENEPKRPPLTGYQLYSSIYITSLSHLAQNERFKEIGRMWSELDNEKKASFNDEAKRRMGKYKKDFDVWFKKLPPDVAAQYEEQKLKKRGSKTVAKPNETKEETAESSNDEEDDSSDSEDSDSSSSEDESDASSSGSDDEESSNSSSGDSSDSSESEDEDESSSSQSDEF